MVSGALLLRLPGTTEEKHLKLQDNGSLALYLNPEPHENERALITTKPHCSFTINRNRLNMFGLKICLG